MKKRVRRAILQILQLKEEFSDQELAEAAAFLSSHGLDDAIDYLLRGHRRQSIPVVAEAPSTRLAELRTSDPERYQALIEFEEILNASSAVTLDDIRRCALAINKSFELEKTRKETIPKFIELLAALPNASLKTTLEGLLNSSRDKGDASFLKLAKYLIEGR